VVLCLDRNRLPAAACLSVPVVHELMQLSLQRMEGALLQELVRLPAAQQLSDADIALLLRLAAGQAAGGTAGPAAAGGAGTSGAGTSGRAEPAEEQQQQLAPPRQHTRPQRAKQGQGQQPEARPCQQQECEPAGSGVLPGLVLQCLQQPKGAAGLFPLLLLPWVQQLPAACVKALLQAAAERHAEPCSNTCCSCRMRREQIQRFRPMQIYCALAVPLRTRQTLQRRTRSVSGRLS
jgi:hypothetical protein